MKQNLPLMMMFAAFLIMAYVSYRKSQVIEVQNELIDRVIAHNDTLTARMKFMDGWILQQEDYIREQHGVIMELQRTAQ
jgi:hypothetical protein